MTIISKEIEFDIALKYAESFWLIDVLVGWNIRRLVITNYDVVEFDVRRLVKTKPVSTSLRSTIFFKNISQFYIRKVWGYRILDIGSLRIKFVKIIWF